MIVPAALAPRAAILCEQLAGPAGGRMFTTALSVSGELPASHFVSSGGIDPQFAAVLADPALDRKSTRLNSSHRL